MNISEAVTVFLGMTRPEYLELKLEVNDIFTKYKDKEHAFPARRILLHPNVQTSKNQTSKVQTFLNK